MVFNNSNDPAHFPEVGTSQETATCAIYHEKDTFKIHVSSSVINRQHLPTLSLSAKVHMPSTSATLNFSTLALPT